MEDGALVIQIGPDTTPEQLREQLREQYPGITELMVDMIEFELEMGRAIREDQQGAEHQPEQQTSNTIDRPLSPHGWD